jgi:hypothetical protein
VRKAVDTATAFKTANGTFDRTWNWTIDKTVDPDAWDLFVGDGATSEYEVSVSADADRRQLPGVGSGGPDQRGLHRPAHGDAHGPDRLRGPRRPRRVR